MNIQHRWLKIKAKLAEDSNAKKAVETLGRHPAPLSETQNHIFKTLKLSYVLCYNNVEI
jgi:hypothetical protein